MDRWIEVVEESGLGFHLGAVVEAVFATATRELCGRERVDVLIRAREHLEREIVLSERNLFWSRLPETEEVVAAGESASEAGQEKTENQKPKKKQADTPKASEAQSRKIKGIVGKVQKFFDGHPGASWTDAYNALHPPYKNANSMAVCLRAHIQRTPARPGSRPHTLPKARPRKRKAENTVQAQAMKRLREEALRTATLDGIEFPDDSSREEYIEQFVANC